LLRRGPELFQVTTLHIVVAHQAPQFLQLGCRTPEKLGVTLDAECEMQGGTGWLQESSSVRGWAAVMVRVASSGAVAGADGADNLASPKSRTFARP
jgi:hypothetical protein